MSQELTFSVKAPKSNREAKFTHGLPSNVAGFLEAYGEDVVYSILKQQAIVKLQAFARERMGKDEEAFQSDESIQAALDAYSFSTTRAVDPTQKALKAITKAGLTPEQKAEMLAILQAELDA